MEEGREHFLSGISEKKENIHIENEEHAEENNHENNNIGEE